MAPAASTSLLLQRRPLASTVQIENRDYSDSDYVQGSDYLLCQLTANKSLSTFESLPAEILAPILDEVSQTSRVASLC